MPRPKTRETQIKIRCSDQVKQSLSKKIIFCGIVYSRKGEVLPGFAEFMELLADKPSHWFEKNFKKEIDKLE